MGVPTATPDRSVGETAADCDATIRTARREPVDEQRRRSISSGKVTFKDGYVEGQVSALDLRRLQDDNRIGDGISLGTQD